MQALLTSNHVRMAIQDPAVAQWALRRLESKKKSADPDVAKLEVFLFDDLTIRRLLDAGDGNMLTQMFRLLSRERFHGTADLLAERWAGWEDSVAGWAAPVIAEAIPDKALDLFDAYITADSLWEDFNKTAGVSRALQLMHSQQARDLAQRMIERMAVNSGGMQGAFALRESVGLAWIHHLPILETLLIDLVTAPEQVRLTELVLGSIYIMMTDGMPFYEHVRDLQNGDTKQSFATLSPLFDAGAPLEELDALITGTEEIDIEDAIVFVCERCKDRNYRPIDVMQSFMANRKEPVQGKLKSPLGHFFLGIGAASWLRTSKDYADCSPEECMRAICADLSKLPDYEGLLARLRECPADEVVRLVTETLPDVEKHYGAGHLARLMGDLRHGEFVPLLLDCLEDEEDDILVEAAMDALSLFGDMAQRALVESWDKFDADQRATALIVLARVGGEATVAPLVRCFPEMRNEWFKTWRDAAEAVPDARLLDVLVPELKRMNPLIDETFLLISTLLDSDHEQLAAVREREAARKAQREKQGLASFFEGAASGSLQLELECSACGDLNVYEVRNVFISPDADKDKPFVGDELTCRSCKTFDCLEISKMGYVALTVEMLKVSSATEEGRAIESPLKFVTAKLWDGRLTSVGSAIEHYTEAIKKDPHSLVDMLSLANGYAGVGRARQAEACFRECLRIDPFSPEAAYALAEILDDRGNRAEAYRVLNRALKHRRSWCFHRLTNTTPQEFTEAFVDFYNMLAPGSKWAPRVLHDSGSVGAPKKTEKKIGPNAPCPCGSGKKYKKCCARKG